MVYGRLPRRPKRVRRARRAPRRKTTNRKMVRGIPPVNTASIRENKQLSVGDGTTVFYRSLALDDADYDRSQSTARAFQEFRIKYVKLTFRPSADTFSPAAGNSIPQLYFQIDKTSAIETDCNFQTFLDMGCRPIRFDEKNIVKIWKPSILLSQQTAPGAVSANTIKTRPWLSTNANSGNPTADWAPNSTDHLGAVWFVTQMNPATPEIKYFVDIETVFEFRKPLWRSTPTPEQKPALML